MFVASFTCLLVDLEFVVEFNSVEKLHEEVVATGEDQITLLGHEKSLKSFYNRTSKNPNRLKLH